MQDIVVIIIVLHTVEDIFLQFSMFAAIFDTILKFEFVFQPDIISTESLYPSSH